MRHLLIALAFLLSTAVAAQERLSLEVIQKLALETSPLQQRKALAAQLAVLHERNISLNNLPKITISGQAAWQSDVFGLPIESPFFSVPEVPKDQYRLAADISQRIWDGGSDRYARRQRELERDAAVAQADVDVYSLKEQVTELFFRTLLLQETDSILHNTRTDLERRLKQAEAQIEAGAALRTSADQVRIQLLRNTQQLDGLKSDKNALEALLGIWINREPGTFALLRPEAPASLFVPAQRTRPEFQLLAVQRRQLELSGDMLALRNQPRIEAFAQTGAGSPNPFNFFETGFEPFIQLGVRAVWSPIDWGRTRRDREINTLQARLIDVQQQALEQRLAASVVRDLRDYDKYTAQIRQDDQLIALQEDILRRAEAQVENGIMTTTEYLSQIDLLTQMRINRTSHILQAIQAIELAKVKG